MQLRMEAEAIPPLSEWRTRSATLRSGDCKAQQREEELVYSIPNLFDEEGNAEQRAEQERCFCKASRWRIW